VLIHVGFALSRISEQDALDQMNTLRILGEAGRQTGSRGVRSGKGRGQPTLVSQEHGSEAGR
jgi:hypothetical protein